MNKAIFRLMVLAVCLLPGWGHAATKYWIGPPSGSFATDANWSTTGGSACGVNANTTVPAAADIATFLSNCTNSVALDADVNVAGINIVAGYTGTLTQNAGVTLTVGTSNFIQAAGTFSGGDSGITNNGAFTLSGGTFISTTGTLTVGTNNVSSGSWTNTAGGTFQHNSGTVVARGRIATWDVNGTETFNHLTITRNTGYPLTIASGNTLIVGGTFTHAEGTIHTGTIQAQGAVVVGAGADGGSATLQVAAAGAQTIEGNGGLLPNLRLSKPSGTLSLGTTDIKVTNLTIDAGNTLSSTTGTLTVGKTFLVSGNWTNTAGGTFQHNSGTVVASGRTATWDVNGTETFNHLTITRDSLYTLTIASGDTLIVAGTFTHITGEINTGTIQAQGAVVVGASANGGSATIQITSAGAQTIEGNGGVLPILRLSKPSGTLSLGTTDIGVSGLTIDAGNTLSSTTGTLTVGKTFILGSWTNIAGGTFQHNSGTVVARGRAATWDVNVTETFNHLTIIRDSNYTLTIASGDTLIVGGTFTHTDGLIATGTIQAQGAVVVGAGADGGNGKLTFLGTAAQTYTQVGNAMDGLVTVNKASGTVTLASAATWNAASQTLTVSSGTLDLAGFELSVAGYSQGGGTFLGSTAAISVNGAFAQSGGAFTSTSGTLTTRPGAAGVSISGGTFSHNSGTVLLSGAGTINTASAQFNDVTLFAAGNLTFSGTTIVNGHLSLLAANLVSGGTIAVKGNVTTSLVTGPSNFTTTIIFNGTADQTLSATATGSIGAVTINKPSGTLFITGTPIVRGGTWTYTAGTVDAGTSTVTFAGVTGTITSGAMTFNNVDFFSGANITVSGTMRIAKDFAYRAANQLAGGTIRVGGNISTEDTSSSAANNTLIILDGSADQSITQTAGGLFTGASFTIDKPSGTATLASDFACNTKNFQVTSGTLSLGGHNITGVNTLVIGPTSTLQLFGSETVTATNKSLQAGWTAIYTGDGDTTADSYTISTLATTYSNLRINSTDGTTDTFSLAADVQVSGVLTLTAGNITTAAHVLIVNSSASVARTSGHVVGNLRKSVAAGSNVTRVFEVGTGVDYTPVTVTFDTVSIAGALTVTSQAGEHANIATSGLDVDQDVNRSYTLTNTGTTFSAYSATFEYVPADLDVGADPAAFEVKNYVASTWQAATTGTRTATSTQATGLTTFGAFAIGELPSAPSVGGFNAYETATAAGAISGVIKTKVAASAFNLSVIALNTAKDAIQTVFTGEVKVELLNAIDNSGTLDANNCNSSWSVVQTLANPTFAGGDSGRKTVAFQENNVWPNARVRVSFPATGAATVVGCSLDNFAIRPSALVLSVTDDTSTTAGPSRALINAVATGGVVHKAGQPFTVTTAVSPGTATNYAGSPAVKTLNCALPAGCVNGALTLNAFGGAGTRTASATYSEVGAFSLELEDTTFAAVDVADGSSILERAVPQSGGPATIGRFIPNDFVLTLANSPAFKTFNSACGSRSFTYVGQSFGFAGAVPQVMITARNADGATTANYKGTLWKVVAAGVSRTYAAAQAMTNTLGGPSVSSHDDGTGTISMNGADLLAFTRSTPIAPFSAVISLTVNAGDTSENGVAGNGSVTATAPAVFDPIAFDSGIAIRFGRLKLTNGNGSELIGMPIALETQYFNGSGFVTNTDDHCTTLPATAVLMSNYQRNLNACETSVSMSGAVAGGKGNLKLSAPGKNNNGSVSLSLNLSAAAAGSTCIAGASQAATAVDLTHLQGSWSGAAYDQNPAARATFGLYRNTEKFIYLRENF